MIIEIDSELEQVISQQAAIQNKSATEIVVAAVREIYKRPAPFVPRDEWERRLAAIAGDCGPGLTDEHLSSEGLYE